MVLLAPSSEGGGGPADREASEELVKDVTAWAISCQVD